MFTLRQATRWAELWLSCWNDRDIDTLLALHGPAARLGGGLAVGDPRASRTEAALALLRHWSALDGGIHSRPAELEQVLWDARTRELAIIFVVSVDGRRQRGYDLVTLDDDARVVAGEPYVRWLEDGTQPAGAAGGDGRMASDRVPGVFAPPR